MRISSSASFTRISTSTTTLSPNMNRPLRLTVTPRPSTTGLDKASSARVPPSVHGRNLLNSSGCTLAKRRKRRNKLPTSSSLFTPCAIRLLLAKSSVRNVRTVVFALQGYVLPNGKVHHDEAVFIRHVPGRCGRRCLLPSAETSDCQRPHYLPR